MHIAYQFPKERKRQLDFFVARNSSDLFRGGGGRRNTLETIKEDCFCPLTTARRCPALQQKKDANLNVKVSIINQLGEKGLPVGGAEGTLWVQPIVMANGSAVPVWGGFLGVTWPNETQRLNMHAGLLMERDVNGGGH